MDADTFSKALELEARNGIPDAVREFRQSLALQVLAGVVLRSPVDTGRFRGSWNVSADSPDHGVLPPAPAGGVTYGLPDIVGKVSKTALTPAFTPVWISNGLPYAQRLEEGWSKQAPTGMVAVTLASIWEK